MITVIHGPPACGKTRHKNLLAARYGARRIVDSWSASDPNRPQRPRSGDLVLTCDGPDAIAAVLPGAKIIAFAEALR